MSDFESEHLSITSMHSWEGEESTSRGSNQGDQKMKVMSSSSDEEGEEEEEEKEKKHEPVSSQGVSAELSEEEEMEGAMGPIQEGATDGGDPVLNEDSSASSPEGDDDGDSADSDSSSEVPGAETCAICLGRMRGEVGSPDSCDHTFCLICILEWAKTNASCPQDRKAFSRVLVRMTLGAEAVDREVGVQKEESEMLLLPEADNPTYCEVCHECDREERLLLCDGCDLGYHLECLDPPLVQVPVEEWFCPICVDANIPSAIGVRPAHQVGESSTSRGRPRRQQSSSQRPRLIPRTRATERIRERVIKKRREKRKKRKLTRKRKIESGELDDPRPAVLCKEQLLFFGNLDSEISSEDQTDQFADHLLACGSGWSSSKNPAVRKSDAARVLRDSAFTPLSTYAGKASSAVMNRVNIQAQETREDDVLSSILEKQSIVLTNSKKLSLTSDRKLKKEDERSDAESFRLEQEENPLMSEPLPSRRPPPEDGEGCRGTSHRDDRRRCSPPRGLPYSRYPHHSSYSRNLSYGHPSRGYELNQKTQREERVYREERMQREESLSGMVHHSPLEDRRRSPPRLSYQRQGPPHQYKNWRNFHPDYRNRNLHAHRDDRQRYQRSPPWRDSGHRQNQPCDSRWERKHTESSGSSSREPSSQERHGRNGKDSHRDDSDFRANRKGQADSPGFSPHDKYPRRNEDSEKHPRRDDDRSRKEDRGYHRHHHHRDHSDHRSYRSSHRTDRESPPSHSSQRSRSYSRSPVRSKSPFRSRSPLRSKSPLRSETNSVSRETHSRSRENSERRRKGNKPSNNTDGAHRMSLSPSQPEETSNDDQQQESQRDTSGYDSISDAKPSPHSSKSQEPSGESPPQFSDDFVTKERLLEDKPTSLKNGANDEKSGYLGESPKASEGMKKEWDVKKDESDVHCDSNVADQRLVPKEINLKEEEASGGCESNSMFIDENEVSDSGMETTDNLLNDAKMGDVMVQNSYKGEDKREKPHKDNKTENSRKNRNGYDTPLHSGSCSEETDKKQQPGETECVVKKENAVERKKRKRLIPGILGRVLEYTPEVELSHWDDEDSSANFPSPFKVIKKTDASDSDKSITLPFSLQRLLPGSKSLLKGMEDRKRASREKVKQKIDADSREGRGGNSSDKVHKSRTEGHHDTPRPDKRDASSIVDPDSREVKGSSSADKVPKSKTEGHHDTVRPDKRDASSIVDPDSRERRGGSSVDTGHKPKTEGHHNTPRPDKRDANSIGDLDSREGKGANSDDKGHKLKTEGHHDTPRPDKRDANTNVKKEEIKSGHKSHKKNKEGHRSSKVDTKLHNDKSKDAVSPTSSHGSSSGKSRHKSSEKATTGESHTYTSQRKESLTSPDCKQEKDHERALLTSHITSLASRTSQEHKDKKEHLEGKHYHNMFGDISDISDSCSDDEKPVKEKGFLVENLSEKQKDTHEKEDKHAHNKTKAADELSDIEIKIIKCNAFIRKGLKQDNAEPPRLTSSPHKGAVKANSQGKTSKNPGLSRDHVMDLFGSNSDSDDAESPEVKSKENSVRKMQEKSHRSSPVKGDSAYRKAREVTGSSKEKERKCEHGSTSKRASEKLSKSTADPHKLDSIHRNGNGAMESYTEKDRNCEQEISPNKSSSEEQSRSTSESPKTGVQKHTSSKESTDNHKGKDLKGAQERSLHKKTSENSSDATSELPEGVSNNERINVAADSHRHKNKKCEEASSPHRKSSEDALRVETEGKKRRETTDSQKKQDKNSQATPKKSPEKPPKAAASEHRDNDSEHKKTEAINTHKEEPRKGKTSTQATTEDHSKGKAEDPLDGKGKTHNNNKERKSSTEEKKLKDKDSASKMESKQPLAAAASLHPTSQTSDRREKKDAGDTYAKQLKASLEMKVVAEVKKWLDPHYRDKNITKEEYKEIVAKCVNKVVSAECGDVIESEKMRTLVEGYVKLYRHRRAKQQPPPSS